MEKLESYLNDHLAGSVAALQLVDRLIETYETDALGPFFQILRNEIQQDQDTLKKMIERLGGQESTARKAGAWVVEKLTHGKIQLSDSKEGEMGLLLALETLVLGITGKFLLWRAVAEACPSLPAFSEFNWQELEKRALDQRERVEQKRMAVACAALAPACATRVNEG